MSEMAEPNGVTLERFKSIWRRLDAIEATKPETMSAEIKGLREDVQALKRGVYSLAFGIPLASLVFAFSIFQVVGH